MAILCLGNSALRLDGHAFIGELALDGSVRAVTGVLPMARCLHAAGVRRLAVAEANAAEAARGGGARGGWGRVPAALRRCPDGSDPFPRARADAPSAAAASALDVSEVRGQEQAKRAWRSPPRAATTCS